MNHLTDEQLSALLDDALPAHERAAADAHLAGCEACRARLAELSALDASLGKALTHDPGESYFADFAERVAQRIAADPLQAGAAPEAPKASKSSASSRSPWSWLTSPRGLALAGSTAALLVTAGIAWMRFHSEQVVVQAMREAVPAPAAPLTQPAAPGERGEARQLARPPVAESAPTTGLDAPSAAPPPPSANAARMQEVRTLPNGQQVPVARLEAQGSAPARQDAGAHALAAPATGSAIAQMKRRAVSPAAEAGAPVPSSPAASAQAGAPADDAKDEAAHATRDGERALAPEFKMAMPPAAAAPHPKAAFAPDTARGRSFDEWGAAKSLRGGRPEAEKLNANGLSSLTARCGKVRDSRGHVVVGAQVTAVRNGVRTARTDTEGSFCIEGLAPGDTLTVMHVGFDPVTVVMTPMTSLAITLEPVGTLGPNSTMLMGKAQTSSPSFSGAMSKHVPAAADSVAPPADVYAGQTFGVRQLARDAHEATAVARRERTAPAFENAAKQWATVLRQVKGAPAYDASFQYVSALRAAYQLESTGERAGRLRSAMAAFLAIAPATLPERATVERWKAELDGH
jgi:hypothetical protein